MDCPYCRHLLDIETKCRNPYCYNYEAGITAAREEIAELEGDKTSLQLIEKNLLSHCKAHKTVIKQLQAQLDAVRGLPPYLFANDENYQIFRKALNGEDDDNMET